VSPLFNFATKSKLIDPMHFLKVKNLIAVVSLLLFIIPFFWLKPGEMDIGGDGGRLYFYDPLNQMKYLASYYVSPFGTGTAAANFAYLPFIAALAIAKQIIGSSYVLISVHNAIKIVVGFLAVYAIVKELIGQINTNSALRVEFASIIAGLFYLSTPAMTENYVKAIPTHNQVFLNPLFFYLLLRFFITRNMKYMWIALMVSLVFSNNFSYAAAPPLFSFYPLAFLFILFYSIFIRTISIPWKKLLPVSLFFLGLHAFHLVPEIFELINPGSHTNTRVFNSESVKEQIGYFYGVLRIPKVSFHLLSYSLTKQLREGAIIVPFIIAVGLFLNRKREKTILLAALFFLVTFFFVSAKITNSTIKLYEWLFYIPGFTVFRNFYGQWQFAFYFFYAILFGLSLFLILSRMKSGAFAKAFSVIIVAYLTISSWRFIDGSLVVSFYEGATDVKNAVVMDPDYEETLAFIRLLPVDGKILILPFTDSYMQVIYGLNDGAFIGHSTIGQLTGKKDFAGYADIAPFSDIFWELSKEKDYEAIKELLGILNIRYIFYNSDTRIYDTTFPGRPYSPSYVRKYMPPDQQGYKEFVEKLSADRIFEQSHYSISTIKDKSFLPHFYIAKELFTYRDDPELSSYGKASAFFPNEKSDEIRALYVDDSTCQTIFKQQNCDVANTLKMNAAPRIHFARINPTKYKVNIFESKEPYILTFSEAFHRNWKVYTTDNKSRGETTQTYFNGEVKEGKHKYIFLDTATFETLFMKSLPETSHFIANGYANAWYIKPSDIEEKQDYELIVEMTGQRIFFISLVLSSIVFGIFILWGVKLYLLGSKRA